MISCWTGINCGLPGSNADDRLFSNVLSHVVPDDPRQVAWLCRNDVADGRSLLDRIQNDRQRWHHPLDAEQRRILSKNGEQVPRILGVTVDVSDVKRAQFQLEQLAKRLMDAQEEERKRISANCTTTLDSEWRCWRLNWICAPTTRC